MDYKTKPASREQLRLLAKLFDIAVGTNHKIKKPVVELLDRLPDIMPFVHYEIVEDDTFDITVPCRGYFDINRNYTIEIKRRIYEGAINGIGAYRGFIMHEIFHPYLYSLGFVPLFEVSFKNNELPPYESVEWQVKCITGEYMMNYKATATMTKEEIVHYCGVSQGFAEQRKKY